jgi:heat-inducible transcriptional repressor
MSELGPRELEVLRSIVEDYVAHGEPVGSAALAGRELDVSSATIRNVMADLEELGYLEKPHPSAGRVPTDKGYRHFVDACIRLREPPPKQREMIEKSLPTAATAEQVMEDATRVLHTLSHFAGVVALNRPTQVTLKRVEFVALREGRVLAILVDQAETVINKLVTVDFPVTQEDLTRIANYLNEIVSDVPLEAIPGRIQAELERERTEYDQLAQRALELGGKTFAETAVAVKERVLIEGETSFLDRPDFADVERMKALLRSFEEKSKLLALMSRVIAARQAQIFIGSESEFCAPAALSVVAAPYRVGNEIIGTLGVIGPTRMHYDRVVSIVDYTARAVSRLLEGA